MGAAISLLGSMMIGLPKLKMDADIILALSSSVNSCLSQSICQSGKLFDHGSHVLLNFKGHLY